MKTCIVCGGPSDGAPFCPEHEHDFVDHLGGVDEQGTGPSVNDRELSDRQRFIDERERQVSDQERKAEAREWRADARERSADDRKDDADMREAHQAESAKEINRILSAAQGRDVRADSRDAAADRRDEVAALEVMLHGADAERPFLGRRQAAKDRKESKTDRSASHIDRYLLAGQDPVSADTSEGDADAD